MKLYVAIAKCVKMFNLMFSSETFANHKSWTNVDQLIKKAQYHINKGIPQMSMSV
jgi:hypothetical protein